ncbi:MAG TPA: hydrogen gas-evolving membrane-bound hydrogenase subunit E [Candidatus Methylomirabilis sp.]|nr:hydrogen gas-evolving membrane-bound hydrogenase subunit E [Candidatus Methylomirabilis sp.]
MSHAEWLLPSIVFVPFAAAILALGIGRITGRHTGILMVLTAVGSFVQGLQLLQASWAGAPAEFIRPWIPGLNIQLGLRGDAFGLFFALLISGIGALVGAYSIPYMPRLAPVRLGQYYAALLAFMGSMLGVALSDDLILLFIFWEITSLASFLLIGFWYEQEDARHGAMTALLVTALGGLAMLVGFIIAGLVSGTFSLSQLTQDSALRRTLAGSPLFEPALLLILGGALTKSAQWPFHFWLPGAMVAPTPISTYLHAATMVKAGVFLLGRMLPLFGDAPTWSLVLVPVGLGTLVLTAFQAMGETDIKAILARTTLATLGLLTFLYGLKAPQQDALQMLSHAAYKGALFLVAGIVEHATHTRDIRQLGGLRRKMPVTFWICLLAALSMAGVWPSFGFLAKEALYDTLLQGTVLTGWGPPWVVIALAVLANALLFAVACRIVIGVFLGRPAPHVEHAHEPGAGLWLSPAILAATALAFSLFAPLSGELVNRFSSSPRADLHLSLVPTHLGPLVLSVVTAVLGILLYIGGRGTEGAGRAVLPTMQRLWDGLLDAVIAAAIGFSRRWQSGSLRWYFSGTLAFTVGLCGTALWWAGVPILRAPISLAEMPWYGLVLCGMLTVSAVMVVRSATRIGAAIALTTNGFLTALIFVVYRSPDILLTQILIESVSTIFILLVIYFMPPFRTERLSAMARLLNLGIAGAVGLAMFVFILLSTSPAFRETRNLAADYLTRSMAEAGGANAVNVIIVDFRAIDTNGEITVLVVVGLVVFGLLRARRKTT